MTESGWPQTRPPVPDDTDERIQFVIHFLMDPCDAPITVYMEAFRDAFTQLVIAWYALDLKNIITAYLRPQNYVIERRFLRHWGGGEKKKRPTSWEKVWQASGIDPNEWLGENLWGGDEVRARKVPPMAQWFWVIEGVIERLLFYFFVLDQVTRFAYSWTSSIVYSEYCAAQADAVFLGEAGPYPLLGIFGWDAQGTYHPRKSRNIDFFNGFGVMATQGSGYAAGSAMIKLPDDGPAVAVIETRMRCTLGPHAGLVNQTHQDIKRGETLQVGAGVPISAGDLVIFEIRVNAGMTLLSTELYYQQAKQFTQ